MMRVLIAVAIQAYVVAANDGDATLLVQAQVSPAPLAAVEGESHEKDVASDKEEDSLVSELLSKPDSMFKSMTDQVASLEGEINKQRKEGQVALASQQATFEAKLMEQRTANQELETSVEEVSSEIVQLTTTNRQLWKRGKELQTDNEQHREELREIRARISDAGEFVDLQMKELADVDAVETRVIGELDHLEGEQQVQSTRKDAMSKIADFGRATAASLAQKVSMLDADQKGSSDPVSILKIMEDTAASLNAEQKASEEKLKAIFKKKFDVEATTHARLLDEQSKATEKRTTLSNVLNRLTEAVKHLESVRDRLKQSILSLGAFSEKIGKEHIEKHAVGEKKVSLSEQGPTTYGRTAHKAGEKGWLSWLGRN